MTTSDTHNTRASKSGNMIFRAATSGARVSDSSLCCCCKVVGVSACVVGGEDSSALCDVFSLCEEGV